MNQPLTPFMQADADFVKARARYRVATTLLEKGLAMGEMNEAVRRMEETEQEPRALQALL